jgi:hypothetical protein
MCDHKTLSRDLDSQHSGRIGAGPRCLSPPRPTTPIARETQCLRATQPFGGRRGIPGPTRNVRWLERMKVVPRADLPGEQRDLLAALGQYLQAIATLLPGVSAHVKDGPAATLLYVLFVRTLQLGRALQDLCIAGYADESRLIGRAMVSAGLTALLIADQDSDSRALLYALEQRKTRRERGTALVRHALMAQSVFEEDDAKQTKLEDETLARHEAAGTRVAAKLGHRPTWSGLSDRQVAGRLNKLHWYDLLYGPASDVTHVSIASMEAELDALSSGNVYIGPRFTTPFMAVFNAGQVVSGVSRCLSGYFGLDAKELIDGADANLKTAIDSFVDATRAQVKDRMQRLGFSPAE